MFGFFLMASLIMLSVSAALIGNMNLFSDAMASGKHSDKNYKYQEDEQNYYSNEGDNKYSPDYNYYQYYQPMQQQDEQSGYNNNNYGYDNDYKDKTISYNTSYKDMKTYSTYPTKDKKYVCQTGQFKGFFVESVEFCKLEIPAGPQGPQGPAGQINFTNTYLVVGPGATITSETPSRAFSASVCDAGDIVLEGGGSVANFLDEGLGNVFQIIRETVTVNEQNGYRVGGVGANLTSFDSNAICIDNPPLRP